MGRSRSTGRCLQATYGIWQTEADIKSSMPRCTVHNTSCIDSKYGIKTQHEHCLFASPYRLRWKSGSSCFCRRQL
ncbi:hypothetical protein HZ326_22223 [Fusarium oxysporum f. sp. albedinis]|nr:hypothetical protein HZ326_22223 [Fusarium oxysporum f. sp. albedinis]